ncbi:phage repressor protein [Mameliella alba]|nr:phage repressor protein [Mameliella alba]MBY6168482.1 phage repressor protein [Mameliella alba]MBY6173501.1 phage repressor protein [Mameliella alba]
MPQTFIEALQNALEQTGKSVRHISDVSGVPYERLRQVARGRTSSTNADDAYRIARAFGVSYERFLSGDLTESATITIAGKVGAGAQVPVFDAYEKGDGPQVAVPPGLPNTGIVAVEITGDSMEPVFSAGDLLFYTRNSHEGVPTEAIGKRCVCEDDNGMGWVKLLRAGRDEGTFDLHSFNDNSATMYGVRLKWAAPVRLHWPADLVRKV